MRRRLLCLAAWATCLVAGPIAAVALYGRYDLVGLLLALPLCALCGAGVAAVTTLATGDVWPLRRQALREALAQERAALRRAEADARFYRQLWESSVRERFDLLIRLIREGAQG